MIESKSWKQFDAALSMVQDPEDVNAKVYKEECMLCFQTPKTGSGIFINTKTYLCYCDNHVGWDSVHSGVDVYFRIQDVEDTEKKAAPAPKKLAIGTSDGFDAKADEKSYIKQYSFVLYYRKLWINAELPGAPECAKTIYRYITSAPGDKHQAKVIAWEKGVSVSKYSEDLHQIDEPPEIPQSDWKCQSCGATENLWLNLSDGYIGCGRRSYPDRGGCRGGTEGAALVHYQELGKKYHLCVKLGTITKNSADVYSYADDEDDSVIDSKLAEHLAHFGINVQKLEKTEQSTTELEIEENMKHDWSAVTEENENLEVVTGPTLRGLINLGNSCYMNSVMQVLSLIPEFAHSYYRAYIVYMRNKTRAQSITALKSNALWSEADDTMVMELGKLIHGLCAESGAVNLGNLSIEGSKDSGNSAMPVLDPIRFKNAFCGNHPDFSTTEQQDAWEFLAYMLNKISEIDRKLVSVGENFVGLPFFQKDYEVFQNLFMFEVQEKITCLQTKEARFRSGTETFLSLDIPLESITRIPASALPSVQANGKGKKGKEKPLSEMEEKYTSNYTVSFAKCMDTWASEDVRDGYMSPVTNKLGLSSHSNRFQTFPLYLIVHMKRFYAAADWSARKIDTLIPAPQQLDLAALKVKSEQNDIPQASTASTNVSTNDVNRKVILPDESMVATIKELGFAELDARRSCILNSNNGVETCVEWILMNMDDVQSDGPVSFSKNGEIQKNSTFSFLLAQGYNEDEVQEAIIAGRNNKEKAIQWLDMYSMKPTVGKGVEKKEAIDTLTSTKYELIGIVSHIGKNANSGHYVAHAKNRGRWVIFNDAKVALSKNPPFDRGYLYLYKRIR